MKTHLFNDFQHKMELFDLKMIHFLVNVANLIRLDAEYRDTRSDFNLLNCSACGTIILLDYIKRFSLLRTLNYLFSILVLCKLMRFNLMLSEQWVMN